MLLEKFGKKSLPLKDIDVEDFDKFIDITVNEIAFCGTYGDPIYHRNFKKLVEVSKKKTNTLSITTNGSYRSKQWWKSILSSLDENDNVTFSIDGTPNNFNKYRINGDWETILVGINACVDSSVNVTWKYIPFSFNEDDIDFAKKIATELGIDDFKISYSDRWENNDWLKPENQNLIGDRSEIQDNFKNKNARDLPIDPKCKNNNDHYISANGYYMPCCYVSDFRFYYKSNWWKNKNIHDIKITKLSQQLEFFNDFYKKIHIDKPEYCLFNCGKCQ
jgi:MoaA/NifB/PqqE/SkfB family radical SAM enzyme